MVRLLGQNKIAVTGIFNLAAFSHRCELVQQQSQKKRNYGLPEWANRSSIQFQVTIKSHQIHYNGDISRLQKLVLANYDL